ncbi:Ig-like domain-containing protein [Alcanivoracaceae bacterium MT1]
MTDEAGNTSEPGEVEIPVINNEDTTAPDPATDVEYVDGNVIGKGEPNTKVTIKDNEGKVIGEGKVNADGTFKVPVEDTNGGTGEVTLTDDAGNTSDPADVTLPDTLAPEAPFDVEYVDGKVIGKGEPGASLEVKGQDGNVIGEGTVNEDGTFEVPVEDTNGGTGKVTQSDAAGNTSAAADVELPDTLAPDAPTDVVYTDGTVTGKGEPDARVRVQDADGNLIGEGTVNEDGTFEVPVEGGVDGEGQVTLTDDAGNESDSTPIVIDLTPPDAPTAEINNTGTIVTGQTEPDAKVEIKDADGELVGTGVADGEGNYEITLDAPQINGGELKVTATDEAGNTSEPASLNAPYVLEAFDVKAESSIADVEPSNRSVKDPEGNEINFGALAGMTGVQEFFNFLTARIGDVVEFVMNNESESNAGWEILPQNGAYQFKVDDSQTADLDVEFNMDSFGSANLTATLLKRIEGTNKWEIIDKNSKQFTQVFIKFNGPGKLEVKDLPEGEYMVTLHQGGFNLSVLPNAYADVKVSYRNYLVDKDGNYAHTQAAEGNVFTGGESQDIRPDDAVLMVKDAQGNYKEVTGPTEVEGDHGTLTIQPNGDYSYQPKPGPEHIGKTDEFNYGLKNPNSDQISTAKIQVEIKEGEFNLGDKVDPSFNALVSPEDPSKVEVISGDDESISFINWVNAGGNERLVNFVTTAIGKTIKFVFTGDAGGEVQVIPADGVYQFTVEDGQSQDLKADFGFNSILSGPQSATMTLLRQVGKDSWEVVQTVSASSTVDLLGLGGSNGTLEQNGLPPGNYVVMLSSKSGIGAGTKFDANITRTVREYEGDGITEAASGKLDRLEGVEAGDQFFYRVTKGTEHDREIDGQDYVKLDREVRLYGDSGILILQPDGKYTYEPFPNPDNIGRVDTFHIATVSKTGEAETHELSFNILDGEQYSHLDASPDTGAEQVVAEETVDSGADGADGNGEQSTGDTAEMSDGEPLLEGDPESVDDVVELSEPSTVTGDSEVAADAEGDMAPLELEEGDSEIQLADEEGADTGLEASEQTDTATAPEPALDTETLTSSPDTILVDDPLKQEMDTPTGIA